jgi:hypothetical protein
MKIESNSRLEDRYAKAQKKLDCLKSFYYSLIAYCLVIPFLIFINYKTYWGFQWFWFPAIGWGIGLAFQGYKAFVSDSILGSRWENRKIEQFMREEEERKGRD